MHNVTADTIEKTVGLTELCNKELFAVC